MQHTLVPNPANHYCHDVISYCSRIIGHMAFMDQVIGSKSSDIQYEKRRRSDKRRKAENEEQTNRGGNKGQKDKNK